MRPVPAAIGAAVGGAVGVNLLLWLGGELAGGSFEFTQDGSTQRAAPVALVMLTALPLAAGMALAAALGRRSPRVLRVAQVLGSAAALATVARTFAADFDTASTVTLALGHVTVVVALVVGLQAVRARLHDP